MKEIYSFSKAHEIVLKDIKDKNIKSYNDWQKKYVKSKNFPLGVARQPQITYKDKGWVSWGHWLGTFNISNKQKNSNFLPYSEARKYVENKVKLQSLCDWKKYAKSSDRPEFIPSFPSRTYKNRGWTSWADWLGVKNPTGGQRKYRINELFFSKWSSNMAYVLGFWFADGCIRNKNVFSISQNEKYILKSILEKMDSDHIIYKDKRSANHNIEIHSNRICKDIMRLGGCKKKSLIMQFPEIPDEYFFDFVRGHFDGDGCITFDKNSKKYMTYFTSASPHFLNSLKHELEIRGIYGTINNQCSLKLNAFNSILLAEHLYMNNPDLRLKRKFDCFVDARKIMESPI